MYSEIPATSIHIIACATVAEELVAMGVPRNKMEILDFALHKDPEMLRVVLQKRIDELPGKKEVLLGYGLCSNGTVGLCSTKHRIICPRVDDCIGIFLGSKAEHRKRLEEEPGTYFLTKGWIEGCDTLYDEFESLKETYGENRAMRIMQVMLKNYKKIALINTGLYELEKCRDYTSLMSGTFSLKQVEIPGSTRLLEKLLNGDWDDEFVIAKPGHKISLTDFMF